MQSIPLSPSCTGRLRSILPLTFALVITFILSGCGSKEEAEQAAQAAPNPADLIAQQPEVHGIEIKKVEITHPLNQPWVTEGRVVYEGKCLPCHKLNTERLVGPGWSGVTKRREPLWILNMVTNVDVKLLELCLVRMPNMNVTPEEARKILEFMRHNDGEP
jgi:hypothetical protein